MRKPSSKSCGAWRVAAMACTLGRIRASTPGADHHNHTLVGAHRLAGAFRIGADKAAIGIRAAVCCSNAASSAERAASALQKRGATLWPLVKALIRENRRDIDRKKLINTAEQIKNKK